MSNNGYITITNGTALPGSGQLSGGTWSQHTGTSYQSQYYNNYTISIPQHDTIIADDSGNTIVSIDKDGNVVWKDKVDIDAAAEALSKSIILSAEIQSGITNKVKLEMRDSVFNDIISIAREKGPLSAEDLTFLLQASKIVEKLKGGE